MLLNALVLACVCIGTGRRLQTPTEEVESNALAQGRVEPLQALATFLLADKQSAAFNPSPGIQSPDVRTAWHRQNNYGHRVSARAVMSEEGTARKETGLGTPVVPESEPTPEEKQKEKEEQNKLVVEKYGIDSANIQYDEDGYPIDANGTKLADKDMREMTFEERLAYMSAVDGLKVKKSESLLDMEYEQQKYLGMPTDRKASDQELQSQWAIYGFANLFRQSINPKFYFNTIKEFLGADLKPETNLLKETLVAQLVFFLGILVVCLLDASQKNFWFWLNDGSPPDWTWEFVFKKDSPSMGRFR